jgi:hypothetical protein
MEPPLFLAMKSYFPKSRHTFIGLLYFLLHLSSIYIHTKWIYLSYEVLFTLYIVFGSQFSIQSKSIREAAAQSAILHSILTLFYIPELFITRGLSMTNPLAALAIYPLLHWLISWLIMGIAIKAKA